MHPLEAIPISMGMHRGLTLYGLQFPYRVATSLQSPAFARFFRARCFLPLSHMRFLVGKGDPLGGGRGAVCVRSFLELVRWVLDARRVVVEVGPKALNTSGTVMAPTQP